MSGSIYNLILGMAISANLIIGLVVLRNNSAARLNRIFFALTLAVTGWAGTNFAYQIVELESQKYLAALASYVFAALLVGCFYLFCLALARPNKLDILGNSRVTVSLVAIFIVGIFASVPGIIATGIGDSNNIETNAVPLAIYGIVLLFVLAQGLSILFKKISATHGTEKRRITTVLASLAVAVAFGLVFNLLLPILGDYSFVAFGPSGTLIFVGGTAYAIFRYSLFDLRPIVARSVAYIASIGLIVAIYSLFGFFVITVLLGESFSVRALIILAFCSAILAIAFQPVKKYFDKVSNRLFYRDKYEPQAVINLINSSLVNTVNLEKLLESTSQIIESELKVYFADFYLYPKASIEFHLAGSNTKMFASPEWAAFLRDIEPSNEKVIIRGQLSDPKVVASMRLLQIECAVKMISSDEYVGYLLIGARKSGNTLSNQDVQLLGIIADEVAIAVQNALRFEEISRFTVTLQKKVADATRELQKSNDKLKQLDEAKDEFISMASHQLRTPLTSVKGYISMILEGDAGDINEMQRKFLDQAYVSSQRMVYLIADLLNVSRLKTGKFIIEPKPTYLPDVVESEIEQLEETIKARGLSLKFDKPDNFVELNLDETKIRQVIMNFVDNAIYYTPKGGRITVALKQTRDSVEYTVTDTGIGVPKTEQHKLFTKFYRAGNARKARPDGTGLGLFMAKKVVVAQGGAIIFNTTEGKGSTFGFSFPRAKLEVGA